jgi:phage gp36-like protein
MYVTTEKVRAAISESTANLLLESRYTDNANERESILLPLIDNAIVEATGTVEGYLMARYPLPLSPVPSVISNLTKDMAIYNLMTRVGIDESSRDKVLIDRNAAAIKFLEKVSKGEIMIGVPSTSGATSPSVSHVGMVSASPAVFSRDKMRGL